MVQNEWLEDRFDEQTVWALNVGGRDAAEFCGTDITTAFSQLRDVYRPGDEVWLYRSPPATWHEGKGERGLALVRSGRIVGIAQIYRSRFRLNPDPFGFDIDPPV